MWCLPCQYKSKIPPRPISTVIERYKTFWTLRNNEDLQRSQNKSSMTFVQNPPAQLKTKLCTWPFAPPINSATTVKKHAELTRWRDKTSHPFTTCDTLVTGMPLWYLSCSYRDDDVTEGQGCKSWLLWSQLVSCDFPQRCRLCTLRTLNVDPPWTISVCIQCPAPEVMRVFFTFDVLNQKHIKEFSMFLGKV